MRRAYLWPASLLFAATCALGVACFVLLARESDRLRQINRSAVEEQSQAVAENLLLTVAEIKTAVMEGLLEFEGKLLEQKLAAWTEQSPLAAFTFVWETEAPASLAVLPPNRFKLEALALLRNPQGSWLWQEPPTAPQTAVRAQAEAEAELEEGLAFDDLAARDADADRAREPAASWEAGALARSADVASPAAAPPAELRQNYAQNLEERQMIRQQSKESSRLAKQRFELPQRWTTESTAWYAKRIDSRAYLIGIARWQAGATVTGVAVRLDTITSSLREAFPARPLPQVASFSVVDDQGNAVLTTTQNRYSIPASRSQTIVTSLRTELPGWTLQTRLADTGLQANAFLLLAGGLLAALILCLFSAGLWLAWQSRHSQLEAARKATFVSNVSHELKTPLTTIRMYAELMHEGRVLDPDKRTHYLHTVVAECQRLTRLVNNVLDFSRLDRGKARLEPRQQPLVPVVKRYLDMRRQEFADAGFVVDTLLPDRVVLAYFDPDAFTQVLGNLIDNALKYAKNGQWIGIDLQADRKWVYLNIRDRGPGLPPERQKKLFKAFERGDSSLVASQSGFGLGLSIAHGLATKMKGHIAYRRDKETGGAHFTIKLRASAP